MRRLFADSGLTGAYRVVRQSSLLLLLALIGLAACTNRGVYEGVQTSNRLECAQQPPSQYDECMERVDLSYDEYQRQREEASTSDSQP